MASKSSQLEALLQKINQSAFSPFDLLHHESLIEKIIELDISGPPSDIPPSLNSGFDELLRYLSNVETEDINIVVFGGGTGLSNLIGGDSRSPIWVEEPFSGLKELFPNIRSIVCISDDGGSTGELAKDLPLIAIGDIRHVLLSSIQKSRLQKIYDLNSDGLHRAIVALHTLFNFRTNHPYKTSSDLFADIHLDTDDLPSPLRNSLIQLVENLFNHKILINLFNRPHCLGNLIIASAIFGVSKEKNGENHTEPKEQDIANALNGLCELLGINPSGVLPCTTTPARLQFLYTDGTLITGEYKSGHSRRNHPVERVFVQFSEKPKIPSQVLESIKNADIILLAPGSLFSSIIPVFQVPEIAQEVRNNKKALKILVSNLWVQKGETDVGYLDPERKYHVSDLVHAYHRNISGGINELFELIIILGLRNIPASVLQNYAVEDKIPIYLDREEVHKLGVTVVEAGFFSQRALKERHVIQHDPRAMARVVRNLWSIRDIIPSGKQRLPKPKNHSGEAIIEESLGTPSYRYGILQKRVTEFDFIGDTRSQYQKRLVDILWHHSDIRSDHLTNIKGISFINKEEWIRCQKWDNVFSYYDPDDHYIKICNDELDKDKNFEIGMLIAIGESLLGNYAAHKSLDPLKIGEDLLGYSYSLTLRESGNRNCFFNEQELHRYLSLIRMKGSQNSPLKYTRIINGDEGFTPPGLIFGLLYAWYLDNRFAPHIEYKMAIMRNRISTLVPEQVKTFHRRVALIEFFRTIVFRYDPIMYPHQIEQSEEIIW